MKLVLFVIISKITKFMLLPFGGFYLKTVVFSWKNVKIALAVLCATVMLATGGCRGIQSVTVGISANSAPMSSRDSDGNPQGFVVEMALEAGKRMGTTINFKYIDMSKGTQNFSNQDIDAIWGEIVPTVSNEKTMLFTSPYLSDSQVLVVKQNSKIDVANDLNGKKVGAVSASLAETALLHSNSLFLKDVNHVKYNELISAFMDLDSGTVDALVVNETYAENRMEQHPAQYSLLGQSLASEKYAVAVRRNDNILRDKFEKALDAMRADGTSATISKKWFDKDLTAVNAT